MSTVNEGIVDGAKRIAAKVRELHLGGGAPGLPLGFRMRGALPSGPPVTGTHRAGDIVPDRAGNWWMCTAGGNGLGAQWAGTYPDQQAALAQALQGSSGLTALQAAIANRNNVRVDIPFVSASAAAGQGASLFGNGYIQQANRAIRNFYPTAANTVSPNSGGLGFVPILPTSSQFTYTSPFTLTSGTSSGAIDIGPQRNAALFAGQAQTFTMTMPAGTTSVKIVYFDYTGTFSYQVASNSAVNIAGGNTKVDIISSDITISGGQTLKIAWVSGQCVVSGILHFNGDESAGITFHEFAHAGWTTGLTAATSGWQQPQSSTVQAIAPSYSWAQFLATISSAAVGIELGGNDTGFFTAAQYQANLTSLIALIRAQSGLSTIPVPMATEYAADFSPVTDPGGWPAYPAAVRAVAAATPYCKVIDTSYRFPSWASNFGGNYLYYNNGSGSIGQVHPSDKGHALLGEIVAAGVRIA